MSTYLSLNKFLGALTHEKPVNFLSDLRILSFMMLWENFFVEASQNPTWKYTCSRITTFKTLLPFQYTSWLIGICILPYCNPMDTQNDGLEKVDSGLKYGHFWLVSILDFWGVLGF